MKAATKKSALKIVPAAKRGFALTRKDFDDYLETLQLTACGLKDLTEDLVAYAGTGDRDPCSPDKAALYPLIGCSEKLEELVHRLKAQFKNQEREDDDYDYLAAEIWMTGEDVQIFESAIAPVCAFTGLHNKSDVEATGSGDEIALSVAEASTLFMHFSKNVVLPIFKARLKESGGAQ